MRYLGNTSGLDNNLFMRALKARMLKNAVQPPQMDESGRNLLRDNTFQRQQQVNQPPVAAAPDRPGLLNRLISGTGAALHEGLTAIQLGPEGYRQKIYQQNVLEPLRKRTAQEEEVRWQTRQGQELQSQKDLLQYKQSLETPKEPSQTEQAQMRLLQGKATPEDIILLGKTQEGARLRLLQGKATPEDMMLLGKTPKEKTSREKRDDERWKIEQKPFKEWTEDEKFFMQVSKPMDVNQKKELYNAYINTFSDRDRYSSAQEAVSDLYQQYQNDSLFQSDFEKEEVNRMEEQIRRDWGE